jgi:hypothetical protein
MSAFFAYRNEGGIFIWKIVVKVALLHEKRSKRSRYFFASIYSISLEMIVKAYLFFLYIIFHKSFWTKFLNLHRYAKKIASARYESLFFSLIYLINSGYALVHKCKFMKKCMTMT